MNNRTPSFYYCDGVVMGRLPDGKWQAFVTQQEYLEYFRQYLFT